MSPVGDKYFRCLRSPGMAYSLPTAIKGRQNGTYCACIFCVFSRWRGGFGISIRCRWRSVKRKTRQAGAHATICMTNGTIQKHPDKTKACEESPITVACYLCNTRPKTICPTPLWAVPLLRVQSPSVIVMLRRRGASRGRPVLGGSLSPSRSCGSVRRREAAKRVFKGLRGPTLGCFTQRIRNLPYRATWRLT